MIKANKKKLCKQCKHKYSYYRYFKHVCKGKRNDGLEG